MNITDEALYGISESLRKISESLEMIAKTQSQMFNENKKIKRNESSSARLINESKRMIKNGMPPQDVVNNILRKELFK